MGRGRSGNAFSSKRKYIQSQRQAFVLIRNGQPCKFVHTFAREHIEALKHLSNEQLAAAILSPAARPSALREQTPSSGHQEGSTPRENQAS